MEERGTGQTLSTIGYSIDRGFGSVHSALTAVEGSNRYTSRSLRVGQPCTLAG